MVALGLRHARGCSEWHLRCLLSAINLAASAPELDDRPLSKSTITICLEVPCGGGRRVKRRNTRRGVCLQVGSDDPDTENSPSLDLVVDLNQKQGTRLGWRDSSGIPISSQRSSSAVMGYPVGGRIDEGI
ncbi:hypothetical protein MYU51_020161 [Penicillium brevicompactum]|uniref:uncharacterized protein n=1 Tax=Penicillium brevicompactum TaxID=5074 RepID=UPI002540FAE4|nr:uncharacterized protein N7506_003989 [Penicillium brevicompactum]KAJ5335967.1 hypothetical protein N7506_003989 [Penicillium brevicompactum]